MPQRLEADSWNDLGARTHTRLRPSTTAIEQLSRDGRYSGPPDPGRPLAPAASARSRRGVATRRRPASVPDDAGEPRRVPVSASRPRESWPPMAATEPASTSYRL